LGGNFHRLFHHSQGEIQLYSDELAGIGALSVLDDERELMYNAHAVLPLHGQAAMFP
jgi:hypothetical protein